MRLVERRIGLLFAVFLALLSIAAVRAIWIGTVRAGSLKERAATQQEEDLTVSAKRGTIFDRNGLELAVSEDAITVFANPFLIDNPAKVAAQLAPLLDMPEDELLRKISGDAGLRLPPPQDGRLGRAQGPAAEDRGHRHRDGAQAQLPAGLAGGAGAGRGGHRERRASPGSSTRVTRICAAPTEAAGW